MLVLKDLRICVGFEIGWWWYSCCLCSGEQISSICVVILISGKIRDEQHMNVHNFLIFGYLICNLEREKMGKCFWLIWLGTAKNLTDCSKCGSLYSWKIRVRTDRKKWLNYPCSYLIETWRGGNQRTNRMMTHGHRTKLLI